MFIYERQNIKQNLKIAASIIMISAALFIMHISLENVYAADVKASSEKMEFLQDKMILRLYDNVHVNYDGVAIDADEVVFILDREMNVTGFKANMKFPDVYVAITYKDLRAKCGAVVAENVKDSIVLANGVHFRFKLYEGEAESLRYNMKTGAIKIDKGKIDGVLKSKSVGR